MKRVYKGISEIVMMIAGIGLLILVTVVGLAINKQQAKVAEQRAAAVKKMIIPTSMPTNTPIPTSIRLPTPTIAISSMSAVLTISSASATMSPTIKTATPTIKLTSTPMVKVSATPSKTP